jgi:hypothetical protein
MDVVILTLRYFPFFVILPIKMLSFPKIPRQVSSDNGRTGPWINTVDYVHCDTARQKFCFLIEDIESCSYGLRPDLIRRSAEEDYFILSRKAGKRKAS